MLGKGGKGLLWRLMATVGWHIQVDGNGRSRDRGRNKTGNDTKESRDGARNKTGNDTKESRDGAWNKTGDGTKETKGIMVGTE